MTAIDPATTTFCVPAELHAFIALVLADAGLQARLGALIDKDAFVAEARAVAAENGIELTEAVLRPCLQSKPLGLAIDAPIIMTDWPPTGWQPARSVQGYDEPVFDWLWFGGVRRGQSFYEYAANQADALPFNRLFRVRTSLQTLVAGAARHESVPLSGIVFHMSRCGSTVVARALMAAEHHDVVSEPEPFDAVVQWAERVDLPLAEKHAAIRAIIAALGRRHSPSQQRFFLKADAWHALSMPLLLPALDGVPWIFLFRHPVEVMMSQMTMPGIQAVPGMLPDKLTHIARPADIPQSEYIAILLSRICDSALEALTSGKGRALDYCHLDSETMEKIAVHFGYMPDPDETAGFAEAFRQNSKNTNAAFTSDSEEKRRIAPANIVGICAQHLMPVYEALTDFEQAGSVQ